MSRRARKRLNKRVAAMRAISHDPSPELTAAFEAIERLKLAPVLPQQQGEPNERQNYSR